MLTWGEIRRLNAEQLQKKPRSELQKALLANINKHAFTGHTVDKLIDAMNNKSKGAYYGNKGNF